MECTGHPRWRRHKKESNVKDFTETYYVSPKACARMWENLNNGGHLKEVDKPKSFLIFIFFLRKYRTQTDTAKQFGVCRATVMKACKGFLPKFQELFKLKVMICVCTASVLFIWKPTLDTVWELVENSPFVIVPFSHSTADVGLVL